MIISTPTANPVVLTSTDAGKMFRPTAVAVPQTYILPDPATCTGLEFTFQRMARNLTIQSYASEWIQLPVELGGFVTSFTLAANVQTVTLTSDGWHWMVVSTAGFFGASAVALPIVKLDSKTFSGVTSVEFKTGFDPVYRQYRFDLFNVSNSGWPGQLSMLLSTDGGATYDTGPNYKHGGVTDWIEGTTQLLAVKDHSGGFFLSADTASHVAHGACGEVVLKTLGGAVHTSYAANMVRTDSGNHPMGTMYRGFYTGGGKVNAVKFVLNLGGANTLAGSIDLWGVK